MQECPSLVTMESFECKKYEYFYFLTYESVHAKRYKMVKVFEFSFWHKTEGKIHRIYFLVF